MNAVNKHLRDHHGYSLAESVRYSPQQMMVIHDDEHRERDCGHDVEAR